MDFDLIKNFFADYTIQSIVIAVIVMIAKLILEKFYKEKMPSYVLTFAPIITVIIIDLTFNMILVEKMFKITKASIYSACLSAGLSTALTALVKRILKGKKVTLDKNQLFLEEILSAYDEDGSKNLLELVGDVLNDLEKDEIVKKQEITIILKEKLEHLTELEVSSVTKIILQTISKN